MKLDDVILKNGFVMDPANQVRERTDVVIHKGKIKKIGREETGSAKQVINAAGCIITPGWIDHHTHLYPLISNGIPAESVCFSSGVTTAVDAGSTGCGTYEKNRPVIKSWRLGTKAYLNVSSAGLSTLPNPENVDPKDFDAPEIKRLFSEYGDELLGLKLRTSKSIVGSLGYEPLRRTVDLADSLGVPVMVHCTDPPGTIDELLSILRPGDILTHMYQNIGDTILAGGLVKEAAWQARERGILFEAADARAHFSFDVGEEAVKEGFLPDLIGTDLTAFSMYQRPTSFNLAMQVSKYTYMGVDIYEVIRRCTELPAKIMGMQGEIGTLAPGRNADVTVVRQETRYNEFGDRPYYDESRNIRKGNFIFHPVLTLKNGEIVYRDMTF